MLTGRPRQSLMDDILFYHEACRRRPILLLLRDGLPGWRRRSVSVGSIDPVAPHPKLRPPIQLEIADRLRTLLSGVEILNN